MLPHHAREPRAEVSERCGACETMATRLYVVPVHRRLSDRAPHVACYFCYLRAVGTSPRRQQLMCHQQDAPR